METANENIITAAGICKAFTVARARDHAERDPRREHAGWSDRFHALRDVSFSVSRRQSVGIIGANGSGKTTLLKILAGVMSPTAGTLDIQGRVGALLEVGAGFHPDLTGEENIRLNGAILGLRRLEISRQLSEIITLSGLERFMDMPVRHYSSGMIVRLGFATAIQLKPDILLLDETFSVGDDEFVLRAYQRITQMREAGASIVVVSHNIQMILGLAERVIWLEKGRVAMDGPAHEVLAAYRDRMGATSLGGARVYNQMIGHAASMRVKETGSAARFAGARWTTPGDHSDDPLEIETGSSLELNVSFKNVETGFGGLILEAWFMRDEGRRETAFSRFELPESRTEHVRIRWDRLPLGLGRYDVILTLRRADESKAWRVEDRMTVDQPLVVPTPSSRGFTVAAELPARWA